MFLMIPIKDDNPTKNRSIMRLVIIVVCSIVFLIQLTGDNYYLVNFYGYKPASLLGNNYQYETFNPILTIVTSMFMHGGWLHFFGNMLYLWIFSDNIEDALGKKQFVIFYFLSGIFAALFQSIGEINSDVPMIGASGAIAGILGAYIYLFPKAKILVIVPLLIFFFSMRLPALIVLGFWFIIQFLNVTLFDSQNSNVAWMAHIGGFIFGIFYCIFFLKKKKKGSSVFLK
tara:strand:- start:393 stop:1079 length:687 start_codon:yes stop_codon:yes gene_type:complete